MKRTTCFALSAFLLFSTTACFEQGNVTATSVYSITDTLPVNCPKDPPTSVPMPTFLDSIYPVGVVNKTDYETSLTREIFAGIRIKISAKELDDSVVNSKDVDYRVNAISNRVRLFVDDILVPNKSTTIIDGLMDAGPFYLSWPVNIRVGHHTAKLFFDLESGKTINYLWTFCIIP